MPNSSHTVQTLARGQTSLDGMLDQGSRGPATGHRGALDMLEIKDTLIRKLGQTSAQHAAIYALHINHGISKRVLASSFGLSVFEVDKRLKNRPRPTARRHLRRSPEELRTGPGDTYRGYGDE